MNVKVWNDNVHPFKQKLNDVDYFVKAKGFIELNIEDANRLVRAYSPIIPDYDGKPKPESYKMLRIDEDDIKKIQRANEAKHKSGSYMCQACGLIVSSKYELNGHIMEEHEEQLEDLIEAKRAIAKEKKKA